MKHKCLPRTHLAWEIIVFAHRCGWFLKAAPHHVSACDAPQTKRTHKLGQRCSSRWYLGGQQCAWKMWPNTKSLAVIHGGIDIGGGIGGVGCRLQVSDKLISRDTACGVGGSFVLQLLTETNLPPLFLAFPFPLKYHNYSEKRIKKTWIEKERERTRERTCFLGEKEKKNNEKK